MFKTFNSLFPLWAIIFCVIAYFVPDFFLSQKTMINPLLMSIMFFMGITLSWKDFARVLVRPTVIGLTVVAQFLLMPFFALIISKILNFETDLLVGMILVGAVSGGTASNVMTYLAKGDVALSVTMTTVSTMLSIVLTPIIVSFYVGNKVDVDTLNIMISLFKIVFAPIMLGVIINYFFSKKIEPLHDVLATFSMLAIIGIIAVVVALNQANIKNVGFLVLVGVVLHNVSGLISGYWLAKIFGYDEKTCKTVAIEVGMQNSGLAASLGAQYFTKLSALPGAIFSVWHNISGALLAGYWSRKS